MFPARRGRPATRLAALLVLSGCAVLVTACSSSPTSPSSATTTSTQKTTTTAARSPTSSAPASTTSTTSQTTGTLAPQTPTGTEFLSPSGNISCEIDDNFGPSSLTSTLCLTISPPRSVTLKTDGTLTVCNGTQCLSNAGEGTPTLQYGMSVTLGPFSCVSSTAGMRCALSSGQGFLLSASGVTPLGGASVVAGQG